MTEAGQTAKQRGRATREAGARRAGIVGLALLLAGVAAASADAVRNPDGVAVIIGNRTYEYDVPAVQYAHRDAAAFRRYVLDVLGFDPENVIYKTDADKATLEGVFGNRESVRGSELWRYLHPEGRSDVVVFYSGHGIPGLHDKRGYLLPVNAHPDRAELNGYPIDVLYRNLVKLKEGQEARSVQVFLDACFSGGSGGGELLGSVSAFTVAPRPEAAGVAKLTRQKLETLLGLSQADRRWIQLGLLAAGHDPGPVRGTFGSKTRAALKQWQAAQGQPATGYVDEAGATTLRQAGQQREADDTAYAQAQATNTAEAYAAYIAAHPEGRHLAEARQLQADAKARADDAAYAQAKKTNTTQAYAAYLRAYPQGRHVADARQLQAQADAAEAALWTGIQGSEDRADYERYLKQYPEGRYVQQARTRLKALGPTIGEVLRDCAACPELVVVPAGSFLMGFPALEAGRSSREGPQHRVTIPAPLAVGRYEVTFAEWDACVAAGGCTDRPNDFGWGRGRRPVMNVSWKEAQEYVQWLSKKTGKAYRLLSEAEWEYVARAGTTGKYWWGNAADHSYANYGQDECCSGAAVGADRWEYTAPVGRFEANAFGLFDTAGNVWEWVEDCWNDSYSGAPSDGGAWTSGDCGLRVLRGGSWDSTPWFLRSAYRNSNFTGNLYSNFGFRMARTLTP